MITTTFTSRRLASLVLVSACLFWLCACGGTSTDKQPETTSSTAPAQSARDGRASERKEPTAGKRRVTAAKSEAERDASPTGEERHRKSRAATAKSGSGDDREATGKRGGKQSATSSPAAAGASPAEKASDPGGGTVGDPGAPAASPEHLVVPNSSGSSVPAPGGGAETPESMSTKQPGS